MKTELIPVIHMLNRKQVLENVETCKQSGIQKVFLINHQVSVSDLIGCALEVKEKYPDMWVGVNMLGVPTHIALSNPLPGIDGLWCDASIGPVEAKSVRKFGGLFFGGLAFKYQPQPTDLEVASAEAKLATDVACTSGTGTGKAPTSVKIKTIRDFIGDHPIAIASGVSIDNVESFKGLANYLLVATSITDKNEMIIADKLKELKSKL